MELLPCSKKQTKQTKVTLVMHGQGHCDLLITDLVITLQVGGDLTTIKLMTLNLFCTRSSYCATK